MSQPVYVSSVWLRSRLGFSRYRFNQLIEQGGFPKADLVLGKTALWRLAGLVGMFPGLTDGQSNPAIDPVGDILRKDARRTQVALTRHGVQSGA